MGEIGHRGEIGGEFWGSKLLPFAAKTEPCSNLLYLQSGRTAIDFVIKDILTHKQAKTALLPSYCCHTMLAPFLENGFTVDFYEVCVGEASKFQISFDFSKCYDVVLFCHYFGFRQKELPDAVRHYHDMGAVVIEDLTHSFLRKGQVISEFSDYAIGSFRKWTALKTGGFAWTRWYEGFAISAAPFDSVYYQMRKDAVEQKFRYMQGIGEQKDHLGTFAEAEAYLEKHYERYEMDSDSWDTLQRMDWDFIVSARRKNAQALASFLATQSLVIPLVGDLAPEECPLFLPVFVAGGERDRLRRYLIEQQIYCPVHWPISSQHRISEKAAMIYSGELSLVCDQRYTMDDMEYVASKIKEFEAKK